MPKISLYLNKQEAELIANSQLPDESLALTVKRLAVKQAEWATSEYKRELERLIRLAQISD